MLTFTSRVRFDHDKFSLICRTATGTAQPTPHKCVCGALQPAATHRHVIVRRYVPDRESTSHYALDVELLMAMPDMRRVAFTSHTHTPSVSASNSRRARHFDRLGEVEAAKAAAAIPSTLIQRLIPMTTSPG